MLPQVRRSLVQVGPAMTRQAILLSRLSHSEFAIEQHLLVNLALLIADQVLGFRSECEL